MTERHNMKTDKIKVMLRPVFILLMIALAVPATSQERKIRERRGWYIGFGLGSGFDAAYHFMGDDITFDEWLEGLDTISPKFSLNFRVGGTISRKLLVGFDLTSVGQMGQETGLTAQIMILNMFAMATYFPFDKGLLFRAGGGLSNLSLDLTTPTGTMSDSVSGFGGLLGIGYSFWLGRRFNLSLYLDHTRQFYSEAGKPERSRATMLYLGFDWY